MFKTYKPGKNAPLDRICDMSGCEQEAVVDCQINYINTWGYMCIEHFKSHGNKELVTW